ncbi:tubulin-specific chaperone A isoform X3 [Dermochelys coriacea]|uniref:tubulin-specific chaperone A isoform X3 n=1 Tax=Dermochelys coriacea TaxID=27794 RepID=UPI001CA9D6BC|nr:tubulin-specific chaperone A isoform X3 [Dermochelys coriacea]
MADPRLRQIKIKMGVVRRLAKEKVMYEKEAKQQEEKIERMKAEASDDYGIKKQEGTEGAGAFYACTRNNTSRRTTVVKRLRSCKNLE